MRRVNAAQVLYGHVAVAAAAAELGLDDEAEKAVTAIHALDPDYGRHVIADLESRHVAPELLPHRRRPPEGRPRGGRADGSRAAPQKTFISIPGMPVMSVFGDCVEKGQAPQPEVGRDAGCP